MIFSLAALAVLSLQAGAAPAEFFVAPHGADAGPGSKAGPFATLARAQQAVRAELVRDRGRDVTVWIDAGNYELEKPLAFGPEDAPTGAARVTYSASGGKLVVISGGQRLSGWTASADGPWTMDVPGVKEGKWYPRQLFISGARRTRARTPNVGELRGLKSDDALRVQFPPETLRAWTHPGDVELVTLVEWTPSRVRLGVLDLEKGTVTFETKIFQFFDKEWGQGIRKNMRNFPFYLENAPEMLDAPGEWYLDRPTGRLTYLPMPGERVEQVETVMPRLEQLLVVRGTGERQVRNLHFHGITFAHTDWALPKHGFLPDQAGFFDTENAKKEMPVPAATVDFQYSTNCALEDCVVRDVGGHAIRYREGCVSNTVAGCRIEGVGGNGVSMGLFDRAAAERDVVRGNIIRDCTIRRCGLDYAGCVGVWAGIARGITVAQNEVSEIPHNGISVGWRWDRVPVGCGGHVVEGNDIHHVVERLTDAGGIYVLGDQPGSVIRRNHIHDITRRTGIAAANGIFFDNGSRGWRVEDNVIYGVSDGAIRHNDNRHEDQSWGTNTLDVRPGDAAFPEALTRQAGPRGKGTPKTP